MINKQIDGINNTNAYCSEEGAIYKGRDRGGPRNNSAHPLHLSTQTEVKKDGLNIKTSKLRS